MELGLLEDEDEQSHRRGYLSVRPLAVLAGILVFGCACFAAGRQSQRTMVASNIELVEWEDPLKSIEKRAEQVLNKTAGGAERSFNETVAGVEGQLDTWKKAIDTALRKAENAVPVRVASVKSALAAWNAVFNLSNPEASRQFFTKDAALVYFNQAGRAQFRTYQSWPGIRRFMEYLRRVECSKRTVDFEETYIDEDGKTLFLVWKYPGTGCKETTETWVYTDDFLIKRITAYYYWEVDELAP